MPRMYDEALRKEAEKHGISVNNLAIQIMKKYSSLIDILVRVNHILTTYIKQHIRPTGFWGSKAGSISGSSVPKNKLLLKGMLLNRSSTIEYITDLIGGYDDWFTCDYHERETFTLLHLRHVYDEKWLFF